MDCADPNLNFGAGKMSNPSESSLKERGSTTVADIMQAADEYAQHAAFVVKHSDLQNETALQLARQKLELVLTRHFGNTEPFATVHVDGSFAHVAYHAGLPDAGEIPLYRAPQMGSLPAVAPLGVYKRLEMLEAFFKAYHEFARCNVELTQLQTKMQKCAKDCA